MPPEIREYYERMYREMQREYEIATEARKKGYDPEDSVEIRITHSVAERAEALLGIPGVAERFEELVSSGEDPLIASVKVMEEIADGKYFQAGREELITRAVQFALLVYTQGVVVAPVEGMPEIKILKNPDGTEYLDVYYASPIRAAGGTAAGLTLIFADMLREKMGLDVWKPDKNMVERHVEEVTLYYRINSKQIRPKDEELRVIFSNLPVRPDGEPTEKYEVSVHRDMEGMPNRVRGGLCLVIGEGILLKAPKLLKLARKLGIEKDWAWLEKISKVKKKGENQMAPIKDYLSGTVVGRPILAYPMAYGGFRLRYGRSRNTGIMARGVHPATMYLVDEFLAPGTQMKVERPGKSTTVLPVDTLEPPIVLLDNGEVRKVRSPEEARRIAPRVKKILFLGDILITYGDFRKTGHFLVPPGYCEEWWVKDAEKVLGYRPPLKVPEDEAIALARKGVPLHPDYLHYYTAVGIEEIKKVHEAVRRARVRKEGDRVVEMVLPRDVKEILELMGVPHRPVDDGLLITENPWSFYLTFNPEGSSDKEDVLGYLSEVSGFVIRDKGGTFIGGRVGRPEAAKPRLMRPPVHVLFPVGEEGGPTRSLNEAARKGKIEVDVRIHVCSKCGARGPFRICPHCGAPARPMRVCPKCGRYTEEEVCPRCGVRTKSHEKMLIDLSLYIQRAQDRLGVKIPSRIKGVKGLTSKDKVAEPVEKGILRALHGVYVFKDGTIRADLLNLPLTHIRPKEIGVSVEKLRELGYNVSDPEETVPLFPSDVVINEEIGDYLVKVAQFVDDLLERFYGLPRYYNVTTRDDLVGKLVIWLAPHTSAAVLGRIVGFTRAKANFAHPYFHMAKRRNCDGEGDAVMLLLDAFINFSRHYLPEKRGGTMDAPLVLIPFIDPLEIDDEVHEMEAVSDYPLEFYEAAMELKDPGEVKVKIVKDILGSEEQFTPLPYSHETASIHAGPKTTKYVQLNDNYTKARVQAELQAKIRAVDPVDAAERVISEHLLRDIVGNMRTFGRQTFRCVSCNAKYRRMPLSGVCEKCGGRIILTVSRGNIEKYLNVAKEASIKYAGSNYIRQRVELIEKEISQIFISHDASQKSLVEFFSG